MTLLLNHQCHIWRVWCNRKVNNSFTIVVLWPVVRSLTLTQEPHAVGINPHRSLTAFSLLRELLRRVLFSPPNLSERKRSLSSQRKRYFLYCCFVCFFPPLSSSPSRRSAGDTCKHVDRLEWKHNLPDWIKDLGDRLRSSFKKIQHITV